MTTADTPKSRGAYRRIRRNAIAASRDASQPVHLTQPLVELVPTSRKSAPTSVVRARVVDPSGAQALRLRFFGLLSGTIPPAHPSSFHRIASGDDRRVRVPSAKRFHACTAASGPE
jgi:hypothetical protein